MLALNHTSISTKRLTSSLNSIKVFAGISAHAQARVEKRKATPINRAALAAEFSATHGEGQIFA